MLAETMWSAQPTDDWMRTRTGNGGRSPEDDEEEDYSDWGDEDSDNLQDDEFDFED